MRCVKGFIKKPHPHGPEYPFIKARIFLEKQEVGIAEFLVDTGGGTTVLSRGDALKLGLCKLIDKYVCVDLIGVGGIEKVCAIKPRPRITLEDAENSNLAIEVIADEPVLLVPLEEPRPKDRKYYRRIYARPSILGWNVLKHARIIIDYTKEEVEICFYEHARWLHPD